MAEPHNVAEKALQKLTDQLTCSVCLDQYTDPKVLLCLHVFCKTCLERLVVKDAATMTVCCPNCRQSTRLPQGGVSGLQTAFYINHLFEVADTLQKVQGPDKTQCEKCGENEAKGYCRNCGEFVCQVCIEVHKKWKEFKSHEIAKMNEVEADVASFVSPKKVVMNCSKHPTEPFKIYCETCHELICRDCTVKTHRDHQYDLVPDAFPKHRDAIAASLQPIKEQLETVNQAIQEVDTRAVTLQEQGSATKDRINSKIDQLHQLLEKRRQELTTKVDQAVHQTTKTLQAQREQYELTHTQISSCIGFVEESLRTGTPEEILSMKKAVVERTEQMAREFDPAMFQPQPAEILHCQNDDIEPITKATRNLCEVSVQSVCPAECFATGSGVESARIMEVATLTVHTVTKEGQKCVDPRAHVDGELISNATGKVVKCEVAEKTDNTYELKYQPNSLGKHKLHLRVYGSHIKSSPLSVSVKSRECQGIHVKTIEGLNRPRQLAVTESGLTVVAERDVNRVSVFDKNGQKLKSFGNESSGKAKLKCPRGIALPGDNTVLVAAEHCIKKFTLEGKFIASAGSEGSGKLQFQSPFAVTTSPTNKKIYICDTNNHRIQVLNSDLTYSNSLGCLGNMPGQFIAPEGIACDSRGNVFVADYGNHRVQMFSPEGEFLYQFQQLGSGMGQIQGPSAVCIDSDDFVYVFEYTAHRVSVFDHKGNHIKSFGSEGSKTGEFSDVYGIAVDGSGHVYVSDCRLDRIQIFK